MASSGSSVQHQFANLFHRLTGMQKALLGMVAVGAIAAIGALVFLVNTPNYATLFTNLSPEDASKIVDKLKEKDTPYQLEDGGKSVLVPKQKVYDLRLALAGEGLPIQRDRIQIFDRTNLGHRICSKVNYRRARKKAGPTILTLKKLKARILWCRKSAVQEDEKPATASVVLKPGREVAPAGRSGHRTLFQQRGRDGSGQRDRRIKGRLLSVPTRPFHGSSSTQYELQQRVESYLDRRRSSRSKALSGRECAGAGERDLEFQVERTPER
jgi:flagellar M-ring protein FliF